MADVIGIAVSKLEEITHDRYLAKLELKTQVESEIVYKIKAKIDGENGTNCLETPDGPRRCQVTGTYVVYVCQTIDVRYA